MKILIDTNVILDVLCDRPEFAEDSSRVWKYCETGQIEGYISALSVPNIVYILRKELTPRKTKEIISKIMTVFDIIDLRSADLTKAAGMLTSDFEDALQICCAIRMKGDYIITRNVRDFKNSKIPVLNPSDFLEILRG